MQFSFFFCTFCTNVITYLTFPNFYISILITKFYFPGIPVAEKFSFSLHTLLSDVAARCPESLDEIITTQVECLTLLTNSIIHLEEQSSNSSSTKLYVCRGTVPVLIGLARAMGRYTITDPPLVCRLYPKPEPPIVNNHVNVDRNSAKNTFSKFWSIIPRSLSGNLSATVDNLGISQVRFFF